MLAAFLQDQWRFTTNNRNTAVPWLGNIIPYLSMKPVAESRDSLHKCLHHWLTILVLTRFLNCIGDCPPRKTVCREIEDVSESATHTRKSLVKGERFIRYVWMAEILWWTRMDASTGSPNDTAHPNSFWQSLAKKLFDADIFEEKATQGLEMIPSTILDIEQGLAGQICV